VYCTERIVVMTARRCTTDQQFDGLELTAVFPNQQIDGRVYYSR
jgi:hypothetical protein